MKFLTVFLIILLISIISCKESKIVKTNTAGDTVNVGSKVIDVKNIWVEYNYDQRRGKRLFEQYCSVCHGLQGKGDGFNSYNLFTKPHSFSDSSYMSNLSYDAIDQIISAGGVSNNKSNEMPAYSLTLKKYQIEYIISYIKTLSK